MKLTEIACKHAQPLPPPSKSPNKLSDGHGLSLWVMPNGAKYWRLAYRFNGKQKNLALGVYPDTSLKQARQNKVDAKELIEQGKDPSIEKKKQKALAVEDNTNTFKTVALEWYEYRKDIWRPRYAAEVIKRLEEDCTLSGYFGHRM